MASKAMMVDLGGGRMVTVEVDGEPPEIATPQPPTPGVGLRGRHGVTPDFVETPNFVETVRNVSEAVRSGLASVKPSKVVVEFGLEFRGEAGIPLVTKGSGAAHVTLTLEWEDGGDDKAPVETPD
jgi:hypothetical protein